MVLVLEIKERYKATINIIILTILIICLGAVAAIVISITYGSMLFTSLFTSSLTSEGGMSTIDLGSVSGVVKGSEDLPVEGALIHVYKHTGLADSTNKNAGYSASITTNYDGTYSYFS